MENILVSGFDTLFHLALHLSDIEDKPVAHHTGHRDRKADRDFDESNLASAPNQEVGQNCDEDD